MEQAPKVEGTSSGTSALSAGLAPALRLFVWDGFCPDYTSGLAFAIAEDETDARKQTPGLCLGAVWRRTCRLSTDCL